MSHFFFHFDYIIVRPHDVNILATTLIILYHLCSPTYKNKSVIIIAYDFSNFRFNWGLTVKNKSERVLKLLEKGTFLKEEREKARRLSHGIKGFGSLNRNTPSTSNGKMDHEPKLFGRSNSQYEKYTGKERDDLNKSDEMERLVSSNLLVKRKAQSDFDQATDHPFYFEHKNKESLLQLHRDLEIIN